MERNGKKYTLSSASRQLIENCFYFFMYEDKTKGIKCEKPLEIFGNAVLLIFSRFQGSGIVLVYLLRKPYKTSYIY